MSPDGKVTATIWAGELEGMRGLAPPSNSYAADPASELAVWFIELKPGATLRLPPAAGGQAINRRMYYCEGESLTVDGETIRPRTEITLRADQSADIGHNGSNEKAVEVLVLQGRPIGEPVAQHGPFVMNTMAEIQQAFADYRRTQFGGWPWPQDAMIFPRTKERFALMNGQEQHPPRAVSEETPKEL